MAKTGTSRFVELFHYLQDPHHVARFQEICGVRGTFSRNSVEIRDTEETHLHNNGVCIHPNSESNKCTVNGGGEGEKTEGLRQRTATSTGHSLKHEGLENVLQNGAAVTTTGCERLGHNTSCSSRGTTTVENVPNNINGSEVDCVPTPQILEQTVKEEDPGPSQSTVKPLRKNSLTGDLGQEFIIHNKFLYYLFTFGTELGNELFYITFFPFCIWNVDAYVCRRLVVIWVWVMYLGQSTKDVIRWSRPASPPVVKVEMFYNSEYSMPSTHAMSGTALPFSLFLLTYERWEYPFMLGLTLALFWCILVCLSRIYMGMHSILDIIAGVLYSILILVVFQPALDLIDNFNQTYRYAPFIIITLHVGMGLFSFTLDTWSTSRGDTAQILGSGAGIALASHLNHRLGLMPDPPLSQLPLSFPDLTISLVAMALLRLCLGVVFLLATRAIMKAVTVPLACRLFGIPSGDVRKARQHMEVELPYRYMVYGTVGFNTLFLVPLLFTYLHLS